MKARSIASVDKAVDAGVGSPSPAVKHDAGKLRFDLIPPDPLKQVAAVYTFGAKEYGPRNWEKGLEWGRAYAAVMRHMWAFWAGEDNDPESGLSHLAHAAWGCFALMYYSVHHPGLDDRGVVEGKSE